MSFVVTRTVEEPHEVVFGRRVVLAEPGGPQRMIDRRRSAAMACTRSLLGPTRWVCPTKSSSVLGLIRSASGTSPLRAGLLRAAAAKRVSCVLGGALPRGT